MEGGDDEDLEMDQLPPEAQQAVREMLASAMDQSDQPDDSPIAQLLAAAERGDLAEFSSLLDAHATDVNEQGDEGDTALHISCLYGHIEIAQECVRRGANVLACDEDGSTPLHDACAGGL